MDLFDWEAFRGIPLCRDPYNHMVVTGFVKHEAIGKINADCPTIEHTGSFSIEGLRFGPGFRSMVDALESEQFRGAFEKKISAELVGPAHNNYRSRALCSRRRPSAYGFGE